MQLAFGNQCPLLRKSQAEIPFQIGIASLNPMQLAAQKSHCVLTMIWILLSHGDRKNVGFLTSPDSRFGWKVSKLRYKLLNNCAFSRWTGDPDWAGDARDGDWFKVNCGSYGGRQDLKYRMEIKHRPASIELATPGRVADQISAEGPFETKFIGNSRLDEFLTNHRKSDLKTPRW